MFDFCGFVIIPQKEAEKLSTTLKMASTRIKKLEEALRNIAILGSTADVSRIAREALKKP